MGNGKLSSSGKGIKAYERSQHFFILLKKKTFGLWFKEGLRQKFLFKPPFVILTANMICM